MDNDQDSEDYSTEKVPETVAQESSPVNHGRTGTVQRLLKIASIILLIAICIFGYLIIKKI